MLSPIFLSTNVFISMFFLFSFSLFILLPLGILIGLSHTSSSSQTWLFHGAIFKHRNGLCYKSWIYSAKSLFRPGSKLVGLIKNRIGFKCMSFTNLAIIDPIKVDTMLTNECERDLQLELNRNYLKSFPARLKFCHIVSIWLLFDDQISPEFVMIQ